jgi:hypothetical protein
VRRDSTLELQVVFVKATFKAKDAEMHVVVTFDATASDVSNAVKAQVYHLGKMRKVSVDGAEGVAILRSVIVHEDHASTWTFESEPQWVIGWLPEASGRSLTLRIRETGDSEA